MRILLICVIAASLAITACTTEEDPNTLKVATAANMQFAMEEIADKFEEKHGISIELSASSSGVLTTQIKNGAPFDVFVSANMRYPEKLHNDGLASPPITYAHGKLILVYFGNYPTPINYTSILSDPSTKQIAIANTETAPYGIATLELLKNEGLYNNVASKLVYGESIGQVNQYIKSKAVDAAFTSCSFISKFKGEYDYVEVPTTNHEPIAQGAVILKHGQDKKADACQLFIDFLQSDECKTILKEFGYEVN